MALQPRRSIAVVVAVAGVIIGLAGLITAITADALPPPASIQASLTNNWVQGQSMAPNATVDIWIDTPMANPPTATSSTDGAGDFFADPDQLGNIDLMPGMTVVVSDGTTTRTLILEGPLAINVTANPAGATGQLPVGAAAHVGVGGPDCGADVDIVDNGAGDLDPTPGLYTVDLSGPCPGGLGTNNVGGHISLSDADGDATIAEPPPPASIQASLTNNWVQGQTLAPNAPVDIWIDTPMANPPTATAGTDADGNFFADPDQLGNIDLMPGMTVVVSDGTATRTLVLEGPLSINVTPNPAGATGQLPVGAAAQIDVGGPDCGAGMPIVDNGAGDLDPTPGLYTVDLSGQCPGGLGTNNIGGQISLNDADGDATIAEPRPPASIQASLTNNWVQGQTLAPNAPVDIWIDTPMANQPTATAGTDADGNFFADPGQLGDVDLVPGMTVVVSDGTATRTLVLEGPLSINVTPNPAGATGQLPVGAAAQIELGGPDCGAGMPIVDNGAGDLNATPGLYTVDLSGQCPGGLGTTDVGGQIFLHDADGNATIAEPSEGSDMPPTPPQPPPQPDYPGAISSAPTVPGAALGFDLSPTAPEAATTTSPPPVKLATTGADIRLLQTALLLVAAGTTALATQRHARQEAAAHKR